MRALKFWIFGLVAMLGMVTFYACQKHTPEPSSASVTATTQKHQSSQQLIEAMASDATVTLYLQHESDVPAAISDWTFSMNSEEREVFRKSVAEAEESGTPVLFPAHIEQLIDQNSLGQSDRWNYMTQQFADFAALDADQQRFTLDKVKDKLNIATPHDDPSQIASGSPCANQYFKCMSGCHTRTCTHNCSVKFHKCIEATYGSH